MKVSWKIKLTALYASSPGLLTELDMTISHGPSTAKALFFYKTTHSFLSTSAGSLGTSHGFFHRSRDRMRSLSLSGVSIGFTRWAPSQPFSGSPPHLKGREWGDVRLILDTKGERVAEQKKRSTRQDLEGRWVNSHGIGAGDTSQKIHTVPFVIIMGKKKTKIKRRFPLTLTSIWTLREIWFTSQGTGSLHAKLCTVYFIANYFPKHTLYFRMHFLLHRLPLVSAQYKTPQYSLCLLSMSLHLGITVVLRSPEERKRLSQTAVFTFLWETATRELVGWIHIISSSFVAWFQFFFVGSLLLKRCRPTKIY